MNDDPTSAPTEAGPGGSDAADPGSYDLPSHAIDLVAEMRALGHAAIQRDLDPATAARVTAALADVRAEIEAAPVVSKQDNLGRRNRIVTFIETGQWPEPPPDGAQLEFDPASFVGGELNPFGIGASYWRNGEEVIGRATLGPCFEGPPERAHGGVICAIFDEVLGSVFRATGTASAFTGELSVRFEAPAPLGQELEFRGRRVGSERRRQYLEGEASGPDGRFATATATFIEMKPEHFAS